MPTPELAGPCSDSLLAIPPWLPGEFLTSWQPFHAPFLTWECSDRRRTFFCPSHFTPGWCQATGAVVILFLISRKTILNIITLHATNAIVVLKGPPSRAPWRDTQWSVLHATAQGWCRTYFLLSGLWSVADRVFASRWGLLQVSKGLAQWITTLTAHWNP